MLRKLIETLAREKTFKRNLPSQFGSIPIFVSPDAQLKYLKITATAFDTEILNIAKNYIRKDDVVWDIGANVGVFAFAAANRAGPQGQVFAVEPDIWLANLIRRSINLSQNQDLSISLLPTAISDKNGIETLLIARRGRASNTLVKAGGNSQMGGIREKQLVTTITLDQLLEVSPPPNFIKIDVEGAEIFVLKGAAQTLSTVRPIIYCEVSINNEIEATDIFKSSDYQLFNVESDGKLLPLEKCNFNTLACPTEKLLALGLIPDVDHLNHP